MKATGGWSMRCKMINPDKTLQEMTTKLDEILDWLTDSPMDNKDYNTLHKRLIDCLHNNIDFKPILPRQETCDN